MAGLLNHRRKNGIGRMNQKIDFYSLSGADDGQGGQTSEIEVSQLTGVPCEIQEMTGYQPTVGVEEGVRKAIEWWKSVT